MSLAATSVRWTGRRWSLFIESWQPRTGVLLITIATSNVRDICEVAIDCDGTCVKIVVMLIF